MVFALIPFPPVDLEGPSMTFSTDALLKSPVSASTAPIITMFADFVFPAELAISVAGTATVLTSGRTLGSRTKDLS